MDGFKTKVFLSARALKNLDEYKIYVFTFI